MLAIKREITVDEHHEIHLSVPELPVGATAEVIVLIQSPLPQTTPNFTELLGRHPRFQSAEEVVNYVRELREDR